MGNFEAAIAEASRVFGLLDARGRKWKTRHVPIYIREHLWIPFYLTEIKGMKVLYTIRPPDERHTHVYFAQWLSPT